MKNYGIFICLSDSKNLNYIIDRTKNLVDNIYINIEKKHLTNPTIGCYNAHIKSLNKGIEIMTEYNLDYIIIGEEDIIIDYNSWYYDNIINSLNNYNRDSNYILHLGGFPTFTNSYKNILENNKNECLLISQIYHTTCYVVNINIANQLLNALYKSSNHIHCDAIFANSGIEQKLVKGNIINQHNIYNSDNTYLHNYLSTYNVTKFFMLLNKFSIFFLINLNVLIFIIIISKSYNTILLEVLIYYIEIIKPYLIYYKINTYLNKNIFTFLELIKLLRIFTFKDLIYMLL